MITGYRHLQVAGKYKLIGETWKCCARDGCDTMFKGKSNKKYCTNYCRTRVWQLKDGGKKYQEKRAEKGLKIHPKGLPKVYAKRQAKKGMERELEVVTVKKVDSVYVLSTSELIMRKAFKSSIQNTSSVAQ